MVNWGEVSSKMTQGKGHENEGDGGTHKSEEGQRNGEEGQRQRKWDLRRWRAPISRETVARIANFINS
jgi:hypothetical protein